MPLRTVIALTISLALLSSACMHRGVAVAARTPGRADDQSFFDVKAGDRLRIVLPLTRNGTTTPQYEPRQQEGATITLSASDLIGFQTLHFEAVGRAHGPVHLRFLNAEESREGKSMPLTSRPQLPFTLPDKPQYMRLVYLIRASEADHNMAFIGARKLEVLEQLTNYLRHNGVCTQSAASFCTLIPTGVAVRPET